MSQVRLYPLSLMLIIGGCAGPMGQIRSDTPAPPPVTSFDGTYRTTIRVANSFGVAQTTAWCEVARPTGCHHRERPVHLCRATPQCPGRSHPGVSGDDGGGRHVLRPGHWGDHLRPGARHSYGRPDRRVGMSLQLCRQSDVGVGLLSATDCRSSAAVRRDAVEPSTIWMSHCGCCCFQVRAGEPGGGGRGSVTGGSGHTLPARRTGSPLSRG